VLKFAGQFSIRTCPTCEGKGKLAAEDTLLRDGRWAKGSGFVPCPTCKGKKIVMAAPELPSENDGR